MESSDDLLNSYHFQLKPIKFPENNISSIENTPQNPNNKAKSMNLSKNQEDINPTMRYKSLQEKSLSIG